MNKLANVVFAYKSSNDDELELNVGDRIEVIGFEEEGWWKGKLKGRIGVFPSNFVQVIETSSPTTQQQQTPNSNNILSNSNKGLNLFGTKSSRNSLSTNSLNSNNNSLINISGNTNHSNNNHNNNNNNLMMNNTQQQDNSGLICAELDPQATITSSERRAKPIRGVGYGDIFSAGGIKPKPLPADPITGNLASDRLNSSSTNPLLKQVPRKPPPPAPTNSLPASVAAVAATVASANFTDISNGNSNDQAPALPPKPANQFSPLIQHSRPPLPAQHQHSSAQQLQPQQQQVREQARVVYAYEPRNDDELAMQVGDIIDIIDKDIEDAGWWKGELRGEIGVFPDNFVKLIEVPEIPQQATTPSTNNQHQQDWRQHRVSNLSQPVTPTYNHQAPTDPTEVKLKSVFAATPKGFSKELESNLEKQSNGAASLLSLKRNKLQQHLPTTDESNTMNEINGVRREPESIVGDSISDSSNGSKLSHITANRAKGPSRRPPSNVLNKRNQLDQTQQPGLMIKRETNGKDDLSPGSLPQIDSLPNSHQSNNSNNISNNDDNNLSSLPPGHQQQSLTTATPVVSSFINNSNNFTKPNTDALTTPIKPSLSLDNVIDNQALVTPKTSLRATPTLDKGKLPLPLAATPVLTATAPTTALSSATNSTPPWMVSLRKTHAEKKRDSVAVTPAQQVDDEAIVSSAHAMKAAVTTAAPPTLSERSNTQLASKTVVADQLAPMISSTQYDNLAKQISKYVSSEISELKEEVKKLHKEFKGIDELKSVLEVMKIELKACQSATENQRRYIKELVNNLADERKKIAAMQDEIDRTLK